VSLVGIYDMLRVELDPNGSFNTTEYGSVKNPSSSKPCMPTHVSSREGRTAYPAIFMATGKPMDRQSRHSRKMIARLQASTSVRKPILLSINAHAGHGIGSAC